MQNPDVEQLFYKGLKAIEDRDMLAALVIFEQLAQLDNKPVYSSYLAFCIARERGQVKKGIVLCEEAIEQDPENSAHYLNLGKILLMASRKAGAIETFRIGLSHEHNQQIVQEIHKLEPRKPPSVVFLSRNNTLNKYLGIIQKLIGLR